MLRRPTLADAPAMFATYAGDALATRNMGWARHATVAATAAFVATALREWATHGTGTYLIEHAGALIGSTGLHHDGPRRYGTGYILGPRFWGHGFATEACRAMVELAHGHAPARLEAYCHADHRASAHVLEKAGLTLEAVLPAHVVFPNLGPALQDVRVYARRC